MKKHLIHYFPVALLLLLAASSCRPTEKETTLAVQPQAVHFGEEGGTRQITIETDFDYWNPAGVPSWLETEKSGHHTLTITAAANPEAAAREGSLTITADDKSVKIDVAQDAKTALATEYERLEFEREGGTRELSVQTNAAQWGIRSAPDWVDARRNGDKLVVKAKENTATTPREGEIEIAANRESVTVGVWQEPVTVLEMEPTLLEFSYKGGEAKAFLTINKRVVVEYHLGDAASFLLEADGRIKVIAHYNRDERPREAKFIVATRDKSVELLVRQAGNTLEEDHREMLVNFYKVTNGDQWKDNTNWLSDKPIDQWEGVSVTEGYGVTYLSLSDNNLTGDLSEAIGNGFEYLSFLSLSDNNLSGPVPKALGKMGKLSMVFLSGNNLSGSIPEEITEKDKLGSLYLHHNRLSGKIPEKLLKYARRLCPQQDGYNFDNFDCNNSRR